MRDPHTNSFPAGFRGRVQAEVEDSSPATRFRDALRIRAAGAGGRAGDADKAIDWTRKVTSIAPDRPFFLYVAPGVNHSPHHAPKEWIDKFKGQFDGGWDKYRQETLKRQIEKGIVPPDAKLTARSEGLPAWDSLNDGQKKVYARMSIRTSRRARTWLTSTRRR